jgi:hypothetical protein
VVVVVVVVPAYALALRRVRVDVSSLARTCVLPLAAAIPATVGCWVLARSGGPPLLLLAGGAVCVVALYVLPMLPWARRRLSELRHPLGDAEAVERIRA